MDLQIHRTHAQDFLRKHQAAKAKYQGPELEVQHAWLTLVAAALIVGPDKLALKEFSGFSDSFIETVSCRMHAASLWKGERSESDEWGQSEDDFMEVVFAHASVAKGVTVRETTVDGIRYHDLYVSQEVADLFAALTGQAN